MKKIERLAVTVLMAITAVLTPLISFADVLPYEPEEEKGSLVVPVIIALVVAAAIAIVIIKRRKK